MNALQSLIARGVAVPFVDAFGIHREAPERTVQRLTQRFSTDPAVAPIIATPGRHHPDLYGIIELENGYKMRVNGSLPESDYGYHHLLQRDGSRRLVMAAPEKIAVPDRTWGWAVQLYAARTADSWGIGDFVDLAHIASRAAQQGAGMVLISPIHATAPTFPQQNSPYSPSSRTWLNAQYINVDAALARYGLNASLVDDVRSQALALNDARLINRDAVWRLKQEALTQIWDSAPQARVDAESFLAEHGDELLYFALYCALAEQFGSSNWREWADKDSRFSRPNKSLVDSLDNPDAVLYYAWQQFLADDQFAAACKKGVDIVADLAVGFDSCGADGWIYQDALAFDFEVGCPPDAHNTEGQRWGLPPFDPDRLIAMDFAPFVAMVRSGLRHAQALRIDHVMQLWRLFWVPADETAHSGAYIHYPVDALLAILRIEARKKGAWICGEDMGTVAEEARAMMADVNMLGYRAAMRTNPAYNPELSMAASSTHDQVTVAGCLNGSDVKWLDRIGKGYDPVHAEHARVDLARKAGVDPDKPLALISDEDITAAVLAQYASVAASPSRVAVVTLDDAGGISERPNMPGTIDAYPNWRIALPGREGVDAVLNGTLAAKIAALMAEHGR